MILRNTTSGPTYSTNPIARDLATFMRRGSALPAATTPREPVHAAVPIGLADLYPSIFAESVAPRGPVAIVRNLARAVCVGVQRAATAFFSVSRGAKAR